MLQKVNQAMKQTKRHWYEDGLVEMAAGSLFLCGAGILLVISTIVFPAVAASAIVAVLAAGLILVIMTIVASMGKRINDTIQVFKDRITYPRTGYVDYPTPEPRRRSPITGMIIVFFVAAFTAFILGILLNTLASRVKLSDWLLSMPMTEGLMSCVLVVILGFRVGIIRFYVLGAFALVAGTASALQNAGDIIGTEIYFVLMGIGLIVSGLMVLIGYLRHAPSVQEK